MINILFFILIHQINKFVLYSSIQGLFALFLINLFL